MTAMIALKPENRFDFFRVYHDKTGNNIIGVAEADKAVTRHRYTGINCLRERTKTIYGLVCY
jgi:hypothetical protein